jgi:hypothetical protein
MIQTITTHGVVRVPLGTTIDGEDIRVTYVMPPAEITIDGPADVIISSREALESCTLEDLHEIQAHLSVITAAGTTQGLIKAIRRHVQEQGGQ